MEGRRPLNESQRRGNFLLEIKTQCAMSWPKRRRTNHALWQKNQTPLTGEEVEKAVRELPRDPEVIAFYKKLADAGALPPR
jgi:hypothetical protein